MFVPRYLGWLALAGAAAANGKVCTVPAGGSTTVDDAPAIVAAFKQCGNGGTVCFQNTTYHINTVLDIRGLKDCEIDLKGTLLVGAPAPTSNSASLTSTTVEHRSELLAE